MAKNNHVGPEDEIWIVFDVDKQSGSTRRTQVIQATEDACRRGWNVAVSNPCFELWLLLHVSDDLVGVTEEDGKSVERLLRSVLGGYDKRRVPDRCLDKDALSRAMTRARDGDVDQASPIPAFPGTRVYRLMESIFRTQAPRASV